MFKLYFAAIAALLSFPAVAQDYQATTTTNAILRIGPGTQFEQTGTVPAGTAVSVDVCFNKGAFCLVKWDGTPDNGFMAGDLMTISGTGQTVLAAERAKWERIEAGRSKSALPSSRREIRTEGDSYMDGAYGVVLNRLISQQTGRTVVNTARGGSEISGVVDRVTATENALLLSDLTIFWDGSDNGIKTVTAYVDGLADAIEALGHDHFIVIPAMHGTLLAEVTAEIERRWPDNVLDWRDVLGDIPSGIPAQYLASPADDSTHLNESAMLMMAKAISSAIAAKGW